MGQGSAGGARNDVHVRLRDAAGRRWRAAQVRVRQRHASERALPGLLVLGTQRGGTTSLYRWLGEHPQVHPPLDKEVQFFSVEWSRGLDWYRCHFGPSDEGRLDFEASPYYLYHPCAPARAASVLPRAKCVALLRDPVARAWSHYHHNVRLGLESLSFVEALDAEPARLAGEAERMRADPTAVSFAHRHYSYLDRGRYGVQVARWRAAVGDRLLLLRSEQLFDEPHRTFQRLLEFLELEPWRPEAYVTGSRSAAPTPPMPERLRSELLGRLLWSPEQHRAPVDLDAAMWVA
jgi:hypothetical protein